MNREPTDEATDTPKATKNRFATSEVGIMPQGEELGPAEECPKCGELIDVSELLPLTLVECPHCHEAISVLQRFHHFHVLGELGRGGMGAVYRAFDTTLHREVALKILLRKKNSQEQKSLLENEAEITAAINHPHVVRVFSTGDQNGLHFIAMEILAGETLQQIIRKRGRLTEFEVLRLGIQMADGLRAAHALGLLHRDIKPGNILFYDTSVAKVTDFGLALDAEEAAKSGREVFGTAYYIAPERILSGGEDVRSDIYSLGATLFHALAGRPPFEGKNASIVAQKHISNVPLSVQAFAPEISSETARILKRTLSANPDDRYADYNQLIEHLKHAQNLLAQRSIASRPVVEDRQSEQMIWSGLTVAMLLMGLVLIGWYFNQSHQAASRSSTLSPPSTPPPFVKPIADLRTPENPASTVSRLDDRPTTTGADHSITPPTNSGTLSGTGTDLRTPKEDSASTGSTRVASAASQIAAPPEIALSVRGGAGGVTIRNWQICGPFGGPGAETFSDDPSGAEKDRARKFFDAATYPPDDGKVDLKAVFSGAAIAGHWSDAKEIRWKPAAIADPDTRLVLGPGAQVWYGATWIYAPTDTELDFAFQGHWMTYLTFFVNKEKVQEGAMKEKEKGPPDNVKPLRLRPGWNQIMFRGYCVGYPPFRAGLVLNGPPEKLWPLKLSGTPPSTR